MSNPVYTVEQIADIVAPIAAKYDVSKLYLFGSYARGDADEKSDIDLRVDGGPLGNLFALGGFYADLEEALKKSLDLVTTDTLRQNKSDIMTRNLIRNMRKDEKLIYEKLS